MAKASINGIKMHYQVKGDGADVILVHGLTATLAFWYNTKVFPVLSRNYRVTAYDLRGHGYSDITPTGYTSRELAGDLLALMDHLGVERARLVSHSFGGSVALHFALLFPERTEGVIICDTGFAALRKFRNIDHWPGWELWKKELPEYGITPDWFSQADREGIDSVLTKSLDVPVQFGIRRGAHRGTPRFRKLLEETSVSRDFRDPAGLTEDRLPTITPPVLAVYGDMSPFRNVAVYLSETLPHCAAAEIPGVGHFFLMHAPDLFLETVEPFLRAPADWVRLHKGASGSKHAVVAADDENGAVGLSGPTEGRVE